MAVVTFLSDPGLSDDFVGVCHSVIARIAPDGRVIDITHGIARHEVRSGAHVLRRSLAFMPAGALVVAVNRGSAMDALGLEVPGRVQIARDA